MANNIENNVNTQIQQMVENYLRFRSASLNDGTHLDEDSLNAFVEGNLSLRESVTFVDHLSGCGFCLHKTAELAELQSHFQATDHEVSPAAEAQPARISEVLSGLFSRLFGSFDTGAVFAHEEKKEDEEPKKEDEISE
jgi:hypothetical protein